MESQEGKPEDNVVEVVKNGKQLLLTPTDLCLTSPTHDTSTCPDSTAFVLELCKCVLLSTIYFSSFAFSFVLLFYQEHLHRE